MVDVRQFCSEMLKRQDFIFTTHSPNLPWRNDSVTPEMCFIPNRISVCRNAFRDLKSPNISRSSKMHSRPIINTKCILGRSRHLVRSQMDFYFAPPHLMDFVSNKMHFVVSKSSILLDFMLLLLMQRYDLSLQIILYVVSSIIIVSFSQRHRHPILQQQPGPLRQSSYSPFYWLL